MRCRRLSWIVEPMRWQPMPLLVAVFSLSQLLTRVKLLGVLDKVSHTFLLLVSGVMFFALIMMNDTGF